MKTRIFVAALAGTAALAAGCSGGSDSKDESAASEPTSAYVTPTEAETTEDSTDPCLLSQTDVQTAAADFLGGGSLEFDGEFSGSEDGSLRCSYFLPEGAFSDGGGSTTVTGERGEFGSLTIEAHTYESAYTVTSGVYDVECEQGGSSPTEVFDSVSSCVTAIEDARGRGGLVVVNPDLGAGFVFDSQSSSYLATSGQYWFEIGVSGIPGSEDFGRAFSAIAERLVALA